VTKALQLGDQRAHLVAGGWKERDLPGFIQAVGPLWTRRERESWGYGILTGPRHANPGGVAHGGLLTTLMDHTISIVAWEAVGRRPCVTVQLDVHFLESVRPGAFVEARASVSRITRNLVFMRGSLQCRQVEVASASAVLKILDDLGKVRATECFSADGL